MWLDTVADPPPVAVLVVRSFERARTVVLVLNGIGTVANVSRPTFCEFDIGIRRYLRCHADRFPLSRATNMPLHI